MKNIRPAKHASTIDASAKKRMCFQVTKTNTVATPLNSERQAYQSNVGCIPRVPGNSRRKSQSPEEIPRKLPEKYPKNSGDTFRQLLKKFTRNLGATLGIISQRNTRETPGGIHKKPLEEFPENLWKNSRGFFQELMENSWKESRKTLGGIYGKLLEEFSRNY